MVDGASSRREKEQRILDCALALLREDGDVGLTMRRLADRAGMRLSNVQYYFKSRENVLNSMFHRYFLECELEIERLAEENRGAELRERARVLIDTGLGHGAELSDMCRIFRELWALSSRNTEVRDQMDQYYQGLARRMAAFVLGERSDPALQARVAALLLPYFEGYSVTARSLQTPAHVLAEMLTDIVMSIVAAHERREGRA